VIALDDSKVPVLKSADIKMVRAEPVVQFMTKLKDELDGQLQNDHKLTALEKKVFTTGFRNARRILKQERTVKEHKGWRCEHYQGRFGSQIRLIAPDRKNRYVKATDTERADYIVLTPIGKTRYKHEREARVAKVQAKEQEQLKKGKEALKRKRVARKQKRAARKKAA
jgi:hypothetical protein